MVEGWRWKANSGINNRADDLVKTISSLSNAHPPGTPKPVMSQAGHLIDMVKLYRHVLFLQWPGSRHELNMVGRTTIKRLSIPLADKIRRSDDFTMLFARGMFPRIQ